MKKQGIGESEKEMPFYFMSRAIHFFILNSYFPHIRCIVTSS